jgi:hypothetical protein
VIPALAEADCLPQALKHLAANPPAWLRQFLVVVVVNHRCDAAAADQAENHQTLKLLAAGNRSWAPLNLAWVDAASAGRELPAGEGVGLARKLGCDLALARLDWTGPEQPILVMLDADTLVAADYLPALGTHFRKAPEGGAVIPFRHQRGTTATLEAAIGRYEHYLFGYALGLSLAGSPYAYPTVGSAVACRATAYIRAGGMNRRLAGEDFYFLQQLAKTGGVAWVEGTLVQPSARLSRRVPFGTGPSLASQLEKGPQSVRSPPAGAFRVLADWLKRAVEAGPGTAGLDLLAEAGAIDPDLGQFLTAQGFPAVWDRLRRNHPTPASLHQAFHCWFDALKTRQLLHRLTTGRFPLSAPQHALSTLLAWAGELAPGACGSALVIRHMLESGRNPWPARPFLSAPIGGEHPGGPHEPEQTVTAGQG